MANLWQGPHLRRHLEQLQDDAELLGALRLELQLIESLKGQGNQQQQQEQGDDDIRKKSWFHSLPKGGSELAHAEGRALHAAANLQVIVQTFISPLEGVVDGSASWEELAAASRFRERRLKLKRNRKRRKKKRQEAAEYRNKAGEIFEQAKRKADEWIARENAKETARKQMEKLNQETAKKAKAERLKLEEEVLKLHSKIYSFSSFSQLELALVVDKLQELRAIRVEKLKKQGCFFPEEDDKFLERVRAAVEEEEKQAAAAGADEHLDKKAEASPPEATGEPAAEPVKNSREEGARRDLPASFAVYYYGSSRDMGRLIETRRSWDRYLTSFGGSRIPGHWVQPSPPSSQVWASFLLNLKKEAMA